MIVCQDRLKIEIMKNPHRETKHGKLPEEMILFNIHVCTGMS